jgi:beta-alanine--pyruvate transaminase
MQGPEYLIELCHGFTYSGHPLAVAAGLATLELYKEEGLFERAKSLEMPFAQAMMSLRAAPHVADIRTIGLMSGIDLDSAPGKPGQRGYEVMERLFHDSDIYVRAAGDTLIVAPPLIITEAHIGEIRDRIAAVLKLLD